MRRPRVILNCVADRYTDRKRERIVEFEGGLISFIKMDDGTLHVSLYQLDPNVIVAVRGETVK